MNTNTEADRKTETLHMPPPAEKSQDQLAAEALVKAEELEAEAGKLRAEHNLPSIVQQLGPDDFGGHNFDGKTNTLWIGIKLDPNIHDYMGARAFLYSMEHVIWQFYREVTRQMRLKQHLAGGVGVPPQVPPQPGNGKKRGGIMSVFGR